MGRTYELRHLTEGDWATQLMELPIVFTGLREECLEYAKSEGYTWKVVPTMMFLGYWSRGDGDCLFPT